QPYMGTYVADPAIRNDLGGTPVVAECVGQYLVDDPLLAESAALQRVRAGSEGDRQEALARIRSALNKLAATTPRYRCTECGFASQRLLWQCPSCKNWETQRPAARLTLDPLLQRTAAM